MTDKEILIAGFKQSIDKCTEIAKYSDPNNHPGIYVSRAKDRPYASSNFVIINNYVLCQDEMFFGLIKSKMYLKYDSIQEKLTRKEYNELFNYADKKHKQFIKEEETKKYLETKSEILKNLIAE